MLLEIKLLYEGNPCWYLHNALECSMQIRHVRIHTTKLAPGTKI